MPWIQIRWIMAAVHLCSADLPVDWFMCSADFICPFLNSHLSFRIKGHCWKHLRAVQSHPWCSLLLLLQTNAPSVWQSAVTIQFSFLKYSDAGDIVNGSQFTQQKLHEHRKEDIKENLGKAFICIQIWGYIGLRCLNQSPLQFQIQQDCELQS